MYISTHVCIYLLSVDIYLAIIYLAICLPYTYQSMYPSIHPFTHHLCSYHLCIIYVYIYPCIHLLSMYHLCIYLAITYPAICLPYMYQSMYPSILPSTHHLCSYHLCIAYVSAICMDLSSVSLETALS